MSAILLPGGVPRPLPHGPAGAAGAPTRPAPAPATTLPPQPRAAARSGLQPPGGGQRSTGLAVVVGVHLLIGWALASGLARDAINIVKKPIEMAIISEAPPPPPPPPPPKVEKIVQQVPKVAPPPAYVPPPEVVVAPPPAPVIQAVQQAEPPKEPVVIAPAPAPAPPAPPPQPVVVKREISVACPGYEAILAQALEEASERVGLRGTVNTLIRIRGNQVTEVLPQSGPKEYHKYVQAAVKRMRCSAGGADEVMVMLPVVFS